MPLPPGDSWLFWGVNPRLFASGSGRLELAQAITNPANPLTARVLVNRVWQHHFGRGLVATAEQFRSPGRTPHPPRAARLAGRPVRRHGLFAQGAASRDLALGHVPARQPVRCPGARGRPGQHPPVANEPPPPRGRSLARRHAGRRRPARSGARRPLGQSRRGRE